MTSTQFELRDQNGILFTGKFSHIAMIWDTNFLNEDFFITKYGKPRNSAYIIKQWVGPLEIVQVIEKLDYPKDSQNQTWITIQVD